MSVGGLTIGLNIVVTAVPVVLGEFKVVTTELIVEEDVKVQSLLVETAIFGVLPSVSGNKGGRFTETRIVTLVEVREQEGDGVETRGLRPLGRRGGQERSSHAVFVDDQDTLVGVLFSTGKEGQIPAVVAELGSHGGSVVKLVQVRPLTRERHGLLTDGKIIEDGTRLRGEVSESKTIIRG